MILSNKPFSILDQLADPDSMHFMSPSDLRILATELEIHGAYQILYGLREGDKMDQIEIFVSYEKKKKKT